MEKSEAVHRRLPRATTLSAHDRNCLKYMVLYSGSGPPDLNMYMYRVLQIRHDLVKNVTSARVVCLHVHVVIHHHVH